MPKYVISYTEERFFECYPVEADSPEEAEEMFWTRRSSLKKYECGSQIQDSVSVELFEEPEDV